MSEGEHSIIHVFRHVLIGLKYLHQRDLVHLDLKPSNLFVRKNVWKLGDLGHITQTKRRRGKNSKATQEQCSYRHSDFY